MSGAHRLGSHQLGALLQSRLYGWIRGDTRSAPVGHADRGPSNAGRGTRVVSLDDGVDMAPPDMVIVNPLALDQAFTRLVPRDHQRRAAERTGIGGRRPVGHVRGTRAQ